MHGEGAMGSNVIRNVLHNELSLVQVCMQRMDRENNRTEPNLNLNFNNSYYTTIYYAPIIMGVKKKWRGFDGDDDNF